MGRVAVERAKTEWIIDAARLSIGRDHILTQRIERSVI